MKNLSIVHVKSVRRPRAKVARITNKLPELPTKMLETRKEDLGNMFKVFEELYKSEVKRSKELFDDHLLLFKDQPSSTKTEVVEGVIESIDSSDDSYFSK